MNTSVNKRNKGWLIVALPAFFLTLICGFQVNSAQAVDAADAIAVRISPNPNHYSVARWYESQGFYGSPQSLTVDGYEAIRDGRTVYVNAANISGNDIYTNIYMISYSQEPSEKTVDILGQVVSHWKFNDGLQEDSSASCSISSLSCASDSDCSNVQTCATEGIAAGSCVLKTVKNCTTDSDCPTNFFCDSRKAKITRDMKRIGRLEEMNEALADYRDSNGRFPVLSAGTYLPNKSVSLWPSWQQGLLSDLAVSPSYVDPINRLGSCPGYDRATCWNKDEKRFANDPAGNTLELPGGSYALVYSSFREGVDYNLCAVLETRSLGYRFAPNDPSDSACVTDTGITTGGSATNTAPVLVDSYLGGQKGKELNGFIKVYDADGDNLNWSMTFLGNWSATGWSAAPILVDTSNRVQKKIYAARAGNAGIYPATVRIDDGRGGVLTLNVDIEIAVPGVFIEAEDAVHVLDKDTPFFYSFYISGENLANPPTYNVAKISGPTGISPTFFRPSGPAVLVSNNRYQINYQGLMPPTEYQIPDDATLGFEITASDRNGKQAKKRFNLKIVSEKPALNFSCPLTSRIGNDYNCLLGNAKQLNHDINYSALGTMPYDLKIGRKNADSDDIYIYGRTYTASGATDYKVGVKATNEYGASSSKEFNLKVNTYCGDGIKQEPNSEGRGGKYNDGYEQCDGAAGTTSNPADSREDRQYKCSNGSGVTVPYEITSGDYCTFAYPLSGGGFCGDGYCQVKFENTGNKHCAIDCDDNTSGGEDDGSCTMNTDCADGFICDITSGECVMRENYCISDTECQAGYECDEENNSCEKKCWNVIETTATVTLRTGDITRTNEITGCNVKPVDNPRCYDFDGGEYEDFPGCPFACNHGHEYLGKTGEGDRCKDTDGWNHWDQRNKYRCWSLLSVRRCFQEPCRSTKGYIEVDGTMGADGKCNKN